MRTFLDDQIDAFFSQGLPDRLGVAVSGGSDSLALLILLRRLRTDLRCVTVDHGLRAASEAEAARVAEICNGLSVPHRTLCWTGWDGSGNVQAQARTARYELISGWAREQNIACVALGHTIDDQAETVVMRLARGSGVDGLCAMAPRRLLHGINWLRPLLSVARADLQAFLRAEGIEWIDDPTNEDDRFDRIKVRKSRAALDALGLTPEVLAQVAGNMAVARDALVGQAADAAARCVTLRMGAVEIDRTTFDVLPRDIARRVFLAALAWVNGAVYAPRQRAVEAAMDALTQSGSATLDGCHALSRGNALWIVREYKAVEGRRTGFSELFDRKWRLSGPEVDPVWHVAALGDEGLAQYPDWRALDVPRQALLPTPALWHGGNLIAAPVVDPRSPWRADVKNQALEFF